MRNPDDVGSAREDLASFADAARKAGGELFMFQKKTRKTSRMDIELAKRRYRMIGAES